MSALPVSIRTAVVLLVSSVLLSSAAAQATTPPTLDVIMGQVNRQYRIIKAGVADKTQNAKTLDALTLMQTAATTAKGMTPTSVEKLPEAQRAARLSEYRKSMVTLLRALIELEENLMADDNTKAAAMIAKIDEIQKAGHTAFRVDE